MAPSAAAMSVRPVADGKYDVHVLGRRVGTVTKGEASACFESRWGSKRLYPSLVAALRAIGEVAARVAERERWP